MGASRSIKGGFTVSLWLLGFLWSCYVVDCTSADFGVRKAYIRHPTQGYVVDVRDTGSGASLTIFAPNTTDGKQPIVDVMLRAVVSPQDEYFPSAPIDSVPGAYAITISVLAIGSYSFHVLSCSEEEVCEPIDGRIYKFNVAGKLSASHSFVSGFQVMYRVGQKVGFNITARDENRLVKTVIIHPIPFLVDITSSDGTSLLRPAKILPLGQGVYSVCFTLIRVETYYVSVTVEGSPVSDGQRNFSTFQNESEDAAKFYLEPDHEISSSVVLVGEHTLNIRCSEASYEVINNFTIVMSAANNASLVLFADRCPDSRANVHCDFGINVTYPGKYSISALLGDTPIMNMPYVLTVVSGMALASKSSIRATFSSVKAGTSVSYNVELVDVYGNPAASSFQNGLDTLQLTVGLFDTDENPLFGDINPIVDAIGAPVAGRFVAVFHVRLAREYTVKAYFGQCTLGEESFLGLTPLLGSGVSLTVEPSSPFGANSLLSLSSNVSAGSATLVKLDVRDSYDNKIGSSGLAAKQIMLNIFKPGYNFSYPLLGVGEHFEGIIIGITIAQQYQVTVLLDDKPFLSGFELSVISGPVSPLDCILSEVMDTIAGESGSFQLQLMDSFGNNVTVDDDGLLVHDYVTVRATYENVNAYVQVTSIFGSVCNVSFLTERAGVYAISFGWEHEKLQTQVSVVPGQLDCRQTLFTGPGIIYSLAGQNISVLVTPRDLYGNIVKAIPEDMALFKITGTLSPFPGAENEVPSLQVYIYPLHMIFSASFFIFNFTTLQAGVSHLTIAFKNESIIYSSVQSTGPLDVRQSYISGLGLRGTVINMPASFYINARDSFGNSKNDPGSFGEPFRVQLCKSGLCNLGIITVVDKHNWGGRYAVTYVTPQPGNYSISVSWFGKDVKGSPALVPVLDSIGMRSLDASKFIICGGFPSVDTCPGLFGSVANQETVISFDAADENGIPLYAGGAMLNLIIHPPPYSGSVQDLENGTYLVSYMINVAGTYNLTLRIDDTAFLNRSITVLPGPTSSKTTSLSAEIPRSCSVGTVFSSLIVPVDEWLNEQIYTSSYPLSNDKFSLVARASTGELAYGITSVAANGSLVASLTVTKAGTYNVSCTLNGEPLSGSTGTLVDFYPGPPVANKSTVRFRTDTIAGALGSITIYLQDSYGNELNEGIDCSAAVSNIDSGVELTAPVCTMSSSSTFELLYNITEAGLYNISFTAVDVSGLGAGFYCNVTVVADQPSADTSTIVGGQGLTSTVSGAESIMLITCLDKWNNTCTGDTSRAFVVFLDTETLPPVYATISSSSNSQDGTLELVANYSVLYPGNYSCRILIGDRDLNGSPFTVTAPLLPSSAENSFAVMDSFAGRLNTSLSSVTLVAGTVGKLKVFIRDVRGNMQDKSIIDILNVRFYPDPTGLPATYPADTFPSYDYRGSGDGTYDITFSATMATYFDSGLGAYFDLPYILSISLVYGNGTSHEISGSPFKYRLIPGEVNVAKTDIIQGQQWADTHGLNWRVDILPKDSFGNIGRFVPALNVSATVQLAYQDRIASSEGIIPDSGIRKEKQQSKSLWSALPLEDSKLFLENTSSGYSEFRDLQILSGGEMLAKDIAAPPLVVDNYDGTYSVTFSVMVSGFYNISLFINDHLIGGPWVTMCYYRVDAGPVDLTRIRPSGQGLGDNLTIAGQPSSILLQLSDKFGNLLSVPSEKSTGYIPYLAAKISIREVNRNGFVDYHRQDASAFINISTHETGGIWLYYQPLKSGQLFLDLIFSSNLTDFKVVGSPFIGSVLPGDVLPGNCIARGCGLTAVLVCTKLACPRNTILLQVQDGLNNVQGSDVSPAICNDLSITADPSLEFSTIAPFNGQCLVTYIARKVSVVNVSIQYTGSPISFSPFQVVVHSNVGVTSPEKCVATGILEGIIVAGQIAAINVQLVDANGVALFHSPDLGSSFVSLSLINSSSMGSYSPSFSSLDNGNGTFSLEFLAQSTGLYYFNILVGVKQIPLGGNRDGYTLQVVSGPTLVETTGVMLASNSTEYRSGMDEIIIEVQPMDSFGNLQDYIVSSLDFFEAQILQPNSETLYSPLVLSSGTTLSGIPYHFWVLEFVPVQAAFEGSLYTFNFLLSNGSSTELVPLKISVVTSPGVPYIPNTQVLGEGASIALAGVLTTFLVQLYDEFDNHITNFSEIAETKISFSLRSSMQQKCRVVFSPAGAICTYVAQASGIYTLDVRVGDLGTKRFPNLLVGAGPVFTPFCKASGDGVGGGVPIYAGLSTRFTIDVYDVLNNTIFDAGSLFNVLLESLEDVNDRYIQPDPMFPLWTGTNYEVYYTPTTAGWSLLHVTRSFMNISGSPFLIEVLPGLVSANTSTVDSASLGPCVSGETHNITLQSRDSFGNVRLSDSDVFHITKIVEAAPDEWASATMASLGQGLYGFSYLCVRAGSSEALPNATQIVIKYGELEVLNVELAVIPASVDLSKCTVTLNGHEHAITISAPGTILIISRDWAGNRLWRGGLNFRAVLVAGDSNVTATLNDTMDGTYILSYTHTVSGNHTILAFLDEELFFQDYVRVYPADADAESTKLIFNPNGYTVGTCLFHIQLFDQFHNNVSIDALVRSGLMLILASEDIPPVFSTPYPVINSNGSQYDVIFRTNHTGVVQVQVNVLGKTVRDPDNLAFLTHVLPGDPDPSTFVQFGAGIKSGGIVNQATLFYVRIKDSFNNTVLTWPSKTLTAAFSPASAVTSPPIVIQIGNGTAQISYVPVLPTANLAVSLMYDGKVVGPTRYVRVKSQVGSWSVKDSVALDSLGVPIDPLQPVLGVVGTDLILTIQPRDADGIDLPGSPDPGTVAFAVRIGDRSFPVGPTEKRSFGFIVNLLVAQKYVVEITSLDGSIFIKNSGFVVFLVPGPSHPARTLYLTSESTFLTYAPDTYAPDTLYKEGIMFDEHDVIEVGSELAITLVPCDEFGNPQLFQRVHGGDVFTALADHVPSSSLASSSVNVNSSGAFHVLYFTPLFGGIYELSIFLNGVQARAFSIAVESSRIDLSEFVLWPLDDMEAGEPSILELHYNGVYTIPNLTEHLFVEFHSPVNALKFSAAIEPTDKSSSFSVSTLITVAGVYVVLLIDSTTKITGEGFLSTVVGSVEIVPGDISNSTTTVDVSPSFTRAGDEIIVSVMGRDICGNLNCSLPLVLSSPLYPLLVDFGCIDNSSTTLLGEYSGSIRFTPTSPGLVNISIIWVNTVIELEIDVLSYHSPTLTGAILSDNLNMIRVLFDEDTDSGYFSGAFNLTGANRCAAFLDISVIPKLGSNPLCTFYDPRTLIISLGNAAEILPGDSGSGDYITIKSGSILNAAGTSDPVKGQVPLQQPNSPISPVANLICPTAVGPCDPLFLDASASSGSGGRFMIFSYTVQGSGDQNIVNFVRAILGNVPSDQMCIRLEPGTLQQGEIYKFTLTVVNFRGDSASTSISVKATASPVPLLSIFGADQIRIGTRSELIQIEAIGTLPSSKSVDTCGRCLNGSSTAAALSSTLSYQWSQSAGQLLDLNATIVNERVLSIPGNQFNTDSTYAFMVTCYFDGFPSSQSTAEISLAIESSFLLLKISGGSRTVNSSESFTLEAVVIDPDDSVDPYGLPYHIKYTWRCEPDLGPHALFLFENQLSNDFGRIITVPAGLLGTGMYNFSVTVDKEPLTEGRTGVTASSIIDASPSNLLSVSLVLQDVAESAHGMSSAQQVMLWCLSEGHDFTWSIESGTDRRTFSDITVAAMGQGSLFIPPHTLVGGASYTVFCSVKSEGAQGVAKVDFSTWFDPSGGTVSLTRDPPDGPDIAGQTLYTLVAYGWTQGEGQGALQYEFRYIADDNTQTVIQPLSTVNSARDFIVKAGSVTFQVYVANPGLVSVRSEDAPQGTLYQLPSIIVMNSGPTGTSTKVTRRSLLSVNSSNLLLDKIFIPRESQKQYYSALQVIEVFGSQYIGERSLNCSHDPSLAQIVNDMLSMISTTDPRYPPPFLSDTVSSGTGPYTALAVACAYSKILGSPGNIGDNELHASLGIMVDKLQQVALHRLNVPSVSGQPYNPCYFDAVDALLNAVHAGCTVTRGSLMHSASKMPLLLAQIVANSVGFGVQSPSYVFRPTFSLLSAQKELLGEVAIDKFTGSVENFRFEVVHSPQFRGSVSASVACFPSFAPLSAGEWITAYFYRDLLAILEVCDFALMGPEDGLSQIISVLVSFTNLVAPLNDTFKILHFTDGTLSLDGFTQSNYRDGTVSLQLINITTDYNISSRLVLAQVASSASTTFSSRMHTFLLLGFALLGLQCW